MRLHKVGRVTSMGRKWRWEGNKHTEPLNLSIVADVALDGALKRELVNFLLLLPTRSAQTRRVSDCFRLSRLTLGSNIHDKLLNTGSWGLEVGYMHIPNYPSCFGWGGFFVWWGLIGAALLHIEIIGRRRCQGVTFSQRNAVNASSGWVGWLGMAGVFGSRMPWGAVSAVSAVHYLPSCSTV